MKYAYLVFMTPYGATGIGLQSKTLLGVHTSRKSANEHFDGVVESRKRREEYIGITWSGKDSNAPDWYYRCIRSAHIQNDPKPKFKTCPSWYAVSELIEMEQWKVSRPKSDKRKAKQ